MIIRDKNSNLALLFAWSGTILPVVLPALIIVVCISALIGFLTSYYIISIPEVPAIGFTIFGVILSIFLSFRNNACYDRWWEGRKLWGALIANARHLIRDSHVLGASERKEVLQKLIIFTNLLRDRLRGQNNPVIIQVNLSKENLELVERLQKNINPSQAMLEIIQKDLVGYLKQDAISDIIYSTLTRHTVELGNIQAGCDRIISTPLPFSYSVLLHRTVYCFCFILPFSLEASLGLWTPILVGLIAYLFLGLDALSAQLEEPFGLQANDLPLNSIVRLIEREVLSSLGEELPPAITPVNYNLE